MSRDSIYSEPVSQVKDFAFDNQVADVFDDMANRSIPLYAEVQRASAQLSCKLLPQGGIFLDLGCSTGNTMIEVHRANPGKELTLIGIDNSEPMLARCRDKLDQEGVDGEAKLICGDIFSEQFPRAHLVALNYTLHFIDPQKRISILSRIAKSLRPGGALILTEKVSHSNRRLEETFTELYYDFKRDNKYSELEIAQKREALQKVLIPLTVEENLLLLRRSGFSAAEIYLKWVSFGMFVATVP